MGQMPVENEIKLRVANAEAGRRLVTEAGFRETRERVFECNEMYDTEDRRLREAGSILRLRLSGDICVLTWKGPARPGPHRAKEEREVRVSRYDEMKFILGVTGFSCVFRYEKYRTEFRQPGGPLVLVLDETPIGFFLELEGEPRAVDETAAVLGFSTSDYITESYGSLYLHDCAARGIPAANMVFG